MQDKRRRKGVEHDPPYVLQRQQRGEIGRRRQLAMRESVAGFERTEYLPDR